MSDERLCIFCEHFDIDAGSQGYSEYTPGSDMWIYCREGVWDLDNEDGLATYRENLLKARTCEMFKRAPWPPVEPRA